MTFAFTLAFAYASPLVSRAQAAQTSSQQQQQQQPTQAPVSRPRTVNTKDASIPTPAQPANEGSQQSGSNNSQQTGAPDSQGSEIVDENDVVRVVSNLVIIPATVVDARGRAITDLRVEDFELRVDGEVKSIGDLSRAETPVHVALLFDNSASLSSAREFEKQAAVRFFQSVVRPIDRAAIYAISTTPTLAQPLTNDVRRLVNTVERFGKPDGATALFDTVTQAADYMHPLAGRKVIVLVSDGTDTVSDASFDDAVNRALRAECQVYVVQTRQVEDPNLHDTVSEQRMYKLAEQTGGAVFVPRSIDELDYVFSQISLDISQQYLLSYYPQEDRTDKYFRFINLRVKSRAGMRVRARKGFYPPSAQGGMDARAQISTVPQNNAPPDNVLASAAAPASSASAASRRKANAPAPAASRNAGGNRKIGPDGPDDEGIRTKPKEDATDALPTFTLTTVAAVDEKTTTPQPLSITNAQPAQPKNSPEPSIAPTPAPTPQRAETESRPSASTAKNDSPATKPSAPNQETQSPKAPVSGGVLNSKALSLPKPMYTQAARNAGASGRVVVEVTIDEQGKVVEARAVSGHALLLQPAVLAAKQARFTPAKLSGEAVRVKGVINYVFLSP